MTDKPLPRPRQVTFSGWSIVVGSVVTILFAYQRVAALGTIESQESVNEFISTPPGEGLGLSVDDVQLAIRLMCLVAGGCAAATAILGWQVLQASRSARVVLSVLAPILFVAGLTSGGLMSALVAAAVAMLWVQPARDWFDGKEPVRDRAAVAATTSAAAPPGSPSSPPSPSSPSSSSSAPPSGPGTPPPPPSGSSWNLPHPDASRATMTGMSEQPYNPYGAPAGPPAGRAKRPGGVTAAGIITMVASGITLAGLAVSMIFIGTSRQDFVDEVEKELSSNSAYQDISPETIANAAIGFLAVLAVWCVIAIVLAVLTIRGSNGARITLVVSASMAALISLLGALVIVPLVLTIAAIATVVLLFVGGAGPWFAAQKHRS
jgi:hypothetical protein